MKTKILKSLCAISVVCGSFSCSDDFLDEMTVYGSFSEDKVYSSYAGAQDRVNTLYRELLPQACQGSGNGSNGQNTYTSTGSPDVWSKSTLEYGGFTDYINPDQELDYTNVTDYFYVINKSDSPWGNIRNANDIIQHVENSEQLTQDEKNKLLGQAYFFRAFRYWTLVKLYGGVPIIDHPQDPIIGDGDGSDKIVPRSPAKECIAFICKDLQKAADMLPKQWSAGDYGRITAGAAEALKGRVQLFYASPLFNRKDDIARWDSAYASNKKALQLLNEGGVGLAYASNGGAQNAQNWAKMFLANDGSDSSVGETVLATLYNNRDKVETANYEKWNGWEHSLRPINVNGSGGLHPTSEMVDLFPMADGLRPGKSSIVYDPLCFWLNRDPRFYRTFAFPGVEWRFDSNGNDLNSYDDAGKKYVYSYFPHQYSGSGSNYQLWSYTWYSKQEDADLITSTSNGYTADLLAQKNNAVYIRKRSDDGSLSASPLYRFSISATTPKGFQQSAAPVIWMRYAEVLLDFAESAAGANHLDEALQALQQIRARVGYTAGQNYGLPSDIASSRERMLAAILYERQVELAYEGKAFDDMRRWMLFDGGTKTFDGEPSSWTLTGFGGNTCTYLGTTPLNGQRRHLIVVYTRTNADQSNEADPVLDKRPKALTLSEAITYAEEEEEYGSEEAMNLADFYTAYLKRKDVNADSNNEASSILFRPQYYFIGFKQSVMQTNPTLLQTVGWHDYSHGSAGTFDPLAE
ncbi:MAG: RagB/SusD family nutrient uptake outer membrane protein [Prevotella sp.]|nr:RagB/SusD family nutrient uptake outer membrane protein [Prevotella sp.]